jgi:hypothetical protein
MEDAAVQGKRRHQRGKRGKKKKATSLFIDSSADEQQQLAEVSARSSLLALSLVPNHVPNSPPPPLPQVAPYSVYVWYQPRAFTAQGGKPELQILPAPRNSHASCRIGHSLNMAIVGGYGGNHYLNDVCLYNTVTSKWTFPSITGTIPSQRYAYAHGATPREMYLFGGFAADGRYSSEFYLLSFHAREHFVWSKIENKAADPDNFRYHVPSARAGATLVPVPGEVRNNIHGSMQGISFLGGGKEGKGSAASNGNGTSGTASSASAAAQGATTLVLFGGAGGNNIVYNDVYVFSVNCGEWQRISCSGSIPPPRSGHSATLIGNRMFIFGGGDPSTGLWNDLYALKLETFTWEFYPTFGFVCPSPRAGHSATVSGRKLVVFGGGDSVQVFNDLYVLDTETRLWHVPEVGGSAPSPRAAHSAVRFGKKIFIFGGSDTQALLNSVAVLSRERARTLSLWPNSSGNAPIDIQYSLESKLQNRIQREELVARNILKPQVVQVAPAIQDRVREIEWHQVGSKLREKLQKRPDMQELQRRRVLQSSSPHRNASPHALSSSDIELHQTRTGGDMQSAVLSLSQMELGSDLNLSSDQDLNEVERNDYRGSRLEDSSIPPPPERGNRRNLAGENCELEEQVVTLADLRQAMQEVASEVYHTCMRDVRELLSARGISLDDDPRIDIDGKEFPRNNTHVKN